MRTVKTIHKAEPAHMGDLFTFRALPLRSIGMEILNPFIFLNHHGPQMYPPGNNGLPFGPHPHRGMETVTFILEGDIMHEDSGGHRSTIKAGGIQWMTAGRGLIHAEVSSDEFKREGGKLEILQLWLNLPAEHKMITPFYKGAQKDEIPKVIPDNGAVTADVISGEWGGVTGLFNSVSNVQLNLVNVSAGADFEKSYPAEYNIFFYIIRGEAEINGTKAAGLELVEFDHNAEKIKTKALKDTLIILGGAPPIKEPIYAQGPFVMNTEEEIYQAYEDYKKGLFGK